MVYLQLFFRQEKHARIADWTDLLQLNFVTDIYSLTGDAPVLVMNTN